MFAAHRAVDYDGARMLGDRSRCPDCHCTVDNRQIRAKQVYVPRYFANEVLDLKGKADM